MKVSVDERGRGLIGTVLTVVVVFLVAVGVWYYFPGKEWICHSGLVIH